MTGPEPRGPRDPRGPRGTDAHPASVRLLRSVGSALLRIPRRWAFVPVLAWAGLIFLGSSRAAPSIGGNMPLAGLLENLGHALEYGVFAVCLALAAPRKSGWVDLRPAACTAILLAVVLYAASDEWHQSFTPDRDATAFDVLTDVVGAAATLGCIAALGRTRGAGKALGTRIALGLFACLCAAFLATYGPELFSSATRA